jgi:hypothetical protein
VYSFLKNKIFLDSKNLTYTSLDFNLGFIENHPDYWNSSELQKPYAFSKDKKFLDNVVYEYTTPSEEFENIIYESDDYLNLWYDLEVDTVDLDTFNNYTYRNISKPTTTNKDILYFNYKNKKSN